jgi:hypothetical protein
MTSIVTPSNQEISIDPYSGKLFDFDNASSRVYLSRSINNLLKTFGDDVIINGLEVIDLAYNSETETVSFTLNPGKCIIDTTLIEFPTESDLSINVSGYDDTGSLLVFTTFRFTETVHNNVSKFKIFYLDPTNRFTYPAQLERQNDRILLANLKFDKTLNTVELLTNSTITINNELIEIYPLTNIIKSARTFIINLFN